MKGNGTAAAIAGIVRGDHDAEHAPAGRAAEIDETPPGVGSAISRVWRGMKALRDVVSVGVWLFPPCRLKNRLLNALGNDISASAVIWPVLVLSCGRFEIADDVSLMPFSAFRRMNRVEVGPRSMIGLFNSITASPEYQRFDDRAGTLRIGESAGITNRHYLDCSGRIELSDGAAIGGIRSIFQSHELDIVLNRPTIGTIVVGENSLTGSSCIVAKGVHIPSRSYVGMGSVVIQSAIGADGRPGLYAGSPARWRRELPDCEWWHRRDTHTLPLTRHDFDTDFDDTDFGGTELDSTDLDSTGPRTGTDADERSAV
ncbi:hypothetical protein IA539_18160 [Gordonia sp. zg691]|uniref:acyltransferase n=1 Tax=Gordonia jinghuaiqii TaxID=2758710 RepID=UPI001662425B|nr:hypothetical protein [Gordonia jinghuaiqii]MBD0863110.1 hypothetical protein [Gordonia jinghuaiqii]